MRKSVGVFLGTLVSSIILFIIFSNFFQANDGEPLEPTLLAIQHKVVRV